MEIVFDRLTCAIAGNVATLTTTAAGATEVHPSHMALAGGGVVVNLTANAAEFFSTLAKYRVTIEKET